MSESHNVSFRDENDQPCPNCGAVVEKFEATRAYPEYRDWAGYECTDCDVRWDWKEWDDGVQKTPDPDPEHQTASLEHRLITHAYQDLCNAVEDGVFTIETPRGSVDVSELNRVNINISRNIVQHVRCAMAGAHSITLKVAWDGEPAVASDLRSHAKSRGEKPVVLHGSMHLWSMQQPIPKIKSTKTPLDGPTRTELSIEWNAVEDVGWR